MDKNIKTSTIMLIAGGVVLFISTLLDWVSAGSFGSSGWDTDLFGLQGIFVAIIGIVIGGGVALNQFGNVSMPDRLLGFNHDQVHLVLGFAAFLLTFGHIIQSNIGIGIHLGWIASAVIVAGAYMDINASSGDSPPTQF